MTLLRLTASRIAGRGCLIAQASSWTPSVSSTNLTSPRAWQHLSARHFSMSPSRRHTESSISYDKTQNNAPQFKEDPFVYTGPLNSAFRRLKIFSLGSFGLSLTLTPFLFLIESGLPMNARFALATIALGTSGLSTSLVAWCAKPYVTTMRRCRPDEMGSAEEVELMTYTLTLRPRITMVYDPSFLIETRRPLAKWELAEKIHLTANRTDAVGTNVHPEPGQEETVAETRNEKGDVIGRWVVKWEENGAGTCHEVGHVVRYFNVHEELLQ
ncbi:hypothetical protein BDZ97DRAFT_988036 [Flammula alnicola]|nr:hypothetical protein BDZ97DRAFT_988036 [Flammula alnicola]